MANNKKCDFCGAPLPLAAKYCEECWNLLASPTPSRLRRYKQRFSVLRGNVFRGNILPKTGKIQLISGISVILLIFLVVALVFSHSNLHASNSIGELAMAPALTPPSQIGTPAPNTATSSSSGSQASSSENAIIPTSAVKCECLEQYDIVLHSPVVATPNTIPTTPPSPMAIPIPTLGLTTIEPSPLLPDPAVISILYPTAPTPYSPAPSDGALPANTPLS